MLKKALALTLALVMLLMPMTASAVTWGEIVSSGYNYDDGSTKVSSGKDGFTTIEGGTVEFDSSNWIGEAGVYQFKNVTSDEVIVGVLDSSVGIEIHFLEGCKIGEVSGFVSGADSYLGIINEAEIDSSIIVEAYDGAQGSVVNAENGTIKGGVISYANNGTATIENSGKITFVNADIDNGKVEYTGDGELKRANVNVDAADGMTADEILKIAQETGLMETGVAKIRYWTYDENGDCTACYEVTEDGEMILVATFVEKEEPYVEPDPVEVQRQLEGIGGVTTSPVWNWQGYLGHSSKPMWIYVNGEKTLMRQRLFWLDDSTKNHTCRVNVAELDPASIELRVGLDMLRTAQRAEISVISILDKEENPVAQFAVSDLMAAFEQYGLVEGELLCVSGDADAEVMKVTLDGEYLPLEEKAE